MPIYEYVCPECEFKFERLRPFSQCNDGAECPRCHHEAERVLSTFACFSTDESGVPSMVGGPSCSSCGAASCDTCGI